MNGAQAAHNRSICGGSSIAFIAWRRRTGPGFAPPVQEDAFMTLRPKSIGFDRCGTLTCFPMHRMACDLCEGRLPPERMHLFVKDLDDPRFGVVMGCGCKPSGARRTPCRRPSAKPQF
jgi:hypothetical protein